MITLAAHFFRPKIWQNPKNCVTSRREKTRIMARPIKETPILYGEDARRFEARMRERRSISSEERADMDLIYSTLRATANF